MTIISPKRWTMKPPCGAQLQRGHPLAAGLYGFWPINEGGGITLVDLAGKNAGTLTGTTWNASQYGATINSAGSAAFGSIPLSLSDTAVVTLSFWMRWAFANDNAIAFEFTSSIANTGSFNIDPNQSTIGAFQVAVGGGGTFNGGTFPRPSAAWHHYAVILMNNGSTAQGQLAYVDGVLQTITQAFSNSVSGNFANSTLYLFSRAGTSFFGTGGLASLAVWKRALSLAEVQRLYVDPWCMLQAQSPQRRFWSIASGIVFNPAWARGTNQIIGGGYAT
jgi:hypothetical protein